MKKEIRTVDEEKGIVQITTTDERWYTIEDDNGVMKFIPSVTWIAGYYPKDVNFMRWLAQQGWDEAETIKKEAGSRGSKVHKACEDLINGEKVKMDSMYLNTVTREMEELTVEEYTAIMSFAQWWKALKDKSESIEVVSVETTTINEKEGYAGTVDLVLKIDGVYWIIDLKTSKSIYPSHRIQISAYKHSLKLDGEVKLAIVQLGYAKNKMGYKFTEIEDEYHVFNAVKEIWAFENSGVKPQQKDYPVEISLVD